MGQLGVIAGLIPALAFMFGTDAPALNPRTVALFRHSWTSLCITGSAESVAVFYEATSFHFHRTVGFLNSSRNKVHMEVSFMFSALIPSWLSG